MTKKKDDSTPTEMMRALADKLDVSEKSKRGFMDRFRDSSKAGQDYKSVRAYVWAGIKEILSKWYVIALVLLGGGATAWDHIEAIFMGLNK